jgi:uncharacterized protein YpbB
MIAEIAQWAEENKPKTSTKTGRKRASRSEDGVFVAKKKRERKGKTVKGETYRKTYALLQEGKDLAAVAKERELTVSTIEGHAAKGIAAGEVEIGQVLADSIRDKVADYIRANAEVGTKDVRTHFGDAYSFGQIHMVQAWLKLEEQDPVVPDGSVDRELKT